MSVVVAVAKDDRVAIASDSQVNFGDLVVPPANHQAMKIRRLGRSYLAVTGWALYENIFNDFIDPKRPPSLAGERAIYQFFLRLWKALHDRYGFVNDQCEEQHSPFGDLAAAFLIANRTGIFSVASDMSVTRFERYYAIGAGNDFALGALHALYDEPYPAEVLAQRAVAAAIAFNPFCGGEIQVHQIR